MNYEHVTIFRARSAVLYKTIGTTVTTLWPLYGAWGHNDEFRWYSYLKIQVVC